MPWGDIVSEPFKIDNDYVNVTAEIVSDEQYQSILEHLVKFGEQFVQARAEHSTKAIDTVSKELKKDLSLFVESNLYYSGKFNRVEVDKNYVSTTNEGKNISILPKYWFEEDFHSLDEIPDLYEEYNYWNMELSYNKEDKKWIIQKMADTGVWSYESTDTVDGSGKLYGPSDEVVAEAKSAQVEAEMEEFIFAYTDASVLAINERDFSIVEPYITKDGPRRKEASDYIEYLDSKDIFETWYGSELEKIEDVEKDKWKVTVIEEFEIIRPDSTDVKKFRTSLYVVRKDDTFLVDELIDTNEIK